MEDRIAKGKLNLLYHILTLDESALASEILSVQDQYQFPGLLTECKKEIAALGLPDITRKEILIKWSKWKWKRELKRKIKARCENELKEKMFSYSKLKDGPMATESFQTKDYLKSMNVEDGRVNFSIRSRMFRAKFNYRNDPKFAAELWRCDSCEKSSIESQQHILHCEAYSELRKDKDINNVQHLVDYMKIVLEIREKLSLIK